jgi:CDP-paratose 2-epimerase
VKGHTGRKQVYRYIEENRIGDHICYYSDLRKARAHYPAWDITVTLADTVHQIVEAWRSRLAP